MRSPVIITESDIRNVIRDAYANGLTDDEDVINAARVQLIVKLTGPLRRISKEHDAMEAN